jgi:hypothetical protein
MKNFKILLFTILTGFLFMACEGEDDSIQSPTNYLLGTWEAREIGGLNANNVLVYEPIETIEPCGFDTFTFLTNDRLVFTEYSTVDGMNCNTFTNNGGYQLDVLDLDLFFTPEGETTTFAIFSRIETLNLTTMVITFSDEDGEIYFLKLFKI